MPTYNAQGLGSDFVQSFQNQPAAQVPDDSFLERAGLLAGTVLPRTINNVSESLANILHLPDEAKGGFLTPEDTALPQASTTGAKVTNFIGGTIAPTALELALTGKVIPQIPGTGIASQVGNAVARDAAGFGLLGAQQDATTGAEQAGEGAALGLMKLLPLKYRLPASLLLGGASKAFADRNNPAPIGQVFGHDVTPGDLSGTLQTLFGVIGGQAKVPTPTPLPIPEEFNPASTSPAQFGTPGKELTVPPVAPFEDAGIDQNPPISSSPINAEFTSRYGQPNFVGPDNTIYADGPEPVSPASPLPELAAPQTPTPLALPEFGDRSVPPSEQPITTPPPTPQTSPVQQIFDPANQSAILQTLPDSAAVGNRQLMMGKLQQAMNLQGVLSPKEAQQFIHGYTPSSDILQSLQNSVPELAPLGLKNTAGWKLHLSVPIENQEILSAALTQEGLVHKVGRNSGQEGKDITVYSGSKEAASNAARIINNKFGNLINNPSGDALKDDISFGGKVFGRFHADGDNQFNQYGSNGIPYLNDDVANSIWGKDTNSVLMEQKADQILKGKYGEFYSGKESNDPIISTAKASDSTELLRLKDQLSEVSSNRQAAEDAMAAGFGDGDTPGEISILRRIEGRLKLEIQDYQAASLTRSLSDPNNVLPPSGPASTVENIAKKNLEEQSSGMMKKKSSQGGFLIPEISAPLGRAVIGGIVGGAIGGATDDVDDHTNLLRGAMIGAGAGAFGPSVIRAAVKALSEQRLVSPEGRQALKGEGQAWGGFAKNYSAPLEEKAGATFNGSEMVGDRLFRFFDKGLGLTLPEEVKAALGKAKGAGSWLMDQVDSSLLKIGLKFNPSEEAKSLTNRYLDGEAGMTAESYLQQLQKLDPANDNLQNYGKFAVTARTSMDGLQRMVASGIGDSSKRKLIIDSLGKYVTRSYKIFNDARWKPSEDSINKLATEIHKGQFFGPDISFDQTQTALRQYIREVKATKGAYSATNPTGIKISQQALQARKELSDNWKKFLGEVTDPTERIYQTIFRLRPMAEASKFFSNVASTEVNGLPQVFDSHSSLQAFSSKLEEALKLDPTNEKLKWQQASLKSFQPVEDQSIYGGLGGKIVSRGVWDNLKTYDSMTEVTNPYLRAISNAHTLIKLSRTAFSPITSIRNIITAPMFGAIARMDYNDVPTAWNLLHDVNHPLRKEIMEMGIGNVDQVKTEFFKEFQNITGSKYNFGSLDGSKLGLGTFDLDQIEKVTRRGFRNILDFYRLPDNMVRVASYLSAKRRIAEQLGLDLSSQVVKDKAASFVNRYTMNYDAVAPLIKGVRQIPLANLFLSYSAEMGRIGKNLVEDIIKGDGGEGSDITKHSRMFALTTLSAMALVPEMLNNASENSLSPQDKIDWEKAKQLLPDYARSRYRFNIQRDPKTKQFSWVDFTGIIPQSDYQQMSKAIMNKDFGALTAANPLLGTQNTPALNIAISQITGKDLQTQRNFRDAGDRFASVAKEVLPPLPFLPGSSEFDRAKEAYTANADGGEGLTNRTGNRLTPSTFWESYLGVRPGGTNLSVLQQRLQSQAKQDVADELAYANDILKSDAAPEVKQKQLAKSRLVLQSIQQRYAEQLGVTVQPNSQANTAATSQRQLSVQ